MPKKHLHASVRATSYREARRALTNGKYYLLSTVHFVFTEPEGSLVRDWVFRS